MKADRVLSLDAFRGLAIILMLLANNQADESHVFAPLAHAKWFGCTLADLAFPFFLFIMGAVVPLSIASRLKRGESRKSIFILALRRSMILAALGIFLKALDWFVYQDFFRLYGVLQRIAMVYLALVIIILIFPRLRSQAGIAVGLLVLYLLILAISSFNGNYQGQLLVELPIVPEKYHNIVDTTDTWIFGNHLYNYDKDLHIGHDPEGLLSTIPSISTGLFGVLFSSILFSRRTGVRKKSAYMAFAGIALVAAGILSQAFIPFCKNLWTPSFVIYTAGWAYLVLLLLYLMVDQKGFRGPVAVLKMYGQNPILIYFIAESIPDIFDIIRWTGPDGKMEYLSHYLITNFLSSWTVPLLGPYAASAILGVVFLVVFGVLAWWLGKQEIYIKI